MQQLDAEPTQQVSEKGLVDFSLSSRAGRIWFECSHVRAPERVRFVQDSGTSPKIPPYESRRLKIAISDLQHHDAYVELLERVSKEPSL